MKISLKIPYYYTDLTQKSEKKEFTVIVTDIVIHDSTPQQLPTLKPETFYICWCQDLRLA